MQYPDSCGLQGWMPGLEMSWICVLMSVQMPGGLCQNRSSTRRSTSFDTHVPFEKKRKGTKREPMNKNRRAYYLGIVRLATCAVVGPSCWPPP